MRAREMVLICLVAGAPAAGCSEPGSHVGLLDYFEPVDSLHIADSVLVPLLEQRDSTGTGLWRVAGLGSGVWLWSHRRSPCRTRNVGLKRASQCVCRRKQADHRCLGPWRDRGIRAGTCGFREAHRRTNRLHPDRVRVATVTLTTR